MNIAMRYITHVLLVQFILKSRQAFQGVSHDHPRSPQASRNKRRGIYQRDFPRGLGSHYIHIRYPGATYEPEAPPPSATQVTEDVDQLRDVITRKIQLEAKIQPGDIDNPNLWLDRMGQLRYPAAAFRRVGIIFQVIGGQLFPLSSQDINSRVPFDLQGRQANLLRDSRKKPPWELDLKHLVETAPQINRDTIIWLLYQKVRLEGDGDVTRVRNSHYVHAQATFRNDDLMVRALLNGDHHLELRAACALAVSYQGAIAICERLANPCQKPLQCRLLRSNLAVAAYRGQGSIIRSLVAQGSRVDSWDDFLGPPLYAAAIFPGRVTIVAFLLKSKANPNVGGSLGTPLLVAMWNRDESVVQLLLQNSEVDPNQPDRQGFTALWWACFSGKSDIVRLLLDHKKTDPNLKCGGQTPLAAAAGRGHEMIVGWLLEREDVFIDLKNGTHCPLWCVAFAGQPHVLQLLLDKLEVSPSVVQMLLERSDVNPNYHDGKGDNPLWEAAKNGHADVVRYLLQRRDLDPNITSYTHDTPL
ncbi:hypothetical protein PENSUB_1924 [Penicillium subrubescens]|uniref:Uncharacterized protein n=1 Tax=Penicillium subrubescens TaxID=1316194 RepID=A0A1Q5UJ30_9EURO|nr:hypothetical protein PENSUB_1924 [Penicillium subrubescens]